MMWQFPMTNNVSSSKLISVFNVIMIVISANFVGEIHKFILNLLLIAKELEWLKWFWKQVAIIILKQNKLKFFLSCMLPRILADTPKKQNSKKAHINIISIAELQSSLNSYSCQISYMKAKKWSKKKKSINLNTERGLFEMIYIVFITNPSNPREFPLQQNQNQSLLSFLIQQTL